jgi:hypothetical protein
MILHFHRKNSVNSFVGGIFWQMDFKKTEKTFQDRGNRRTFFVLLFRFFISSLSCVLCLAMQYNSCQSNYQLLSFRNVKKI